MDLLLFDIDGTLLRTQGAGRQALDEAFLAVHGWADATAGVSLAGATDGGILAAVSARFGPVDEAAVRTRYLTRLAERVVEPGRATACPGVHAVLERLAGRAHCGILTGNWRAGAAVKLRAVGLERPATGPTPWFEGAYGDDSADRDALVPMARRRAEEAGLSFDRVVVIGDTPADVRCARAGGAIAVAVETGFATREELRAAAPDLLLSDLDRGAAWLLALVA